METPRIVTLKDHFAEANWVTIPENSASTAVDADLDARIKELSKTHQAARDDFFEHAYPEPSSVSRITRILRRIF